MKIIQSITRAASILKMLFRKPEKHRKAKLSPQAGYYNITLGGKERPIACNYLAAIVKIYETWKGQGVAWLPPTLEQIAGVYYWCLLYGTVAAGIERSRNKQRTIPESATEMDFDLPKVLQWVKAENGTHQFEQNNHELCRMIAAEMLDPITPAPDEMLAAVSVIGKLKQPIEQPAAADISLNLTFPKQPQSILNYNGTAFN